MKQTGKIIYVFVILCVMLAGCNRTAGIKAADRKPDILHIDHDGNMRFRDRLLPEDDVIIYPDGFGGEKAAIKLYPPHHKPFYRDSIIVKRPETVE